MSARFIVSRKCDTKEELTLTGLLDLQRQQGLLAMFEEAALAGEMAPADLDDELELAVAGTDEVLTVTFRQLQEHTAELKQYRRTCRICPVNVTGRVGGCITYLPYPVSEGLEYLFWLAARQAVQNSLPQDRLPFVRLFMDRAGASNETPWVDSMRRSGYLMASQARVVASGPFWARTRISSSQLLEYFFRPAQLAGEELLVHAGFLGTVTALGLGLSEQLQQDDERLTALYEDLAPYKTLHKFMQRASLHEQGIQVWP